MIAGRLVLWSLAGLAVALAVAVETATAAKNPPPPPLPGGTVWFETAGSLPRRMWRMNPDGSAKTAAPVLPAGVVMMSPSRALHGGHRWFVGARLIPGAHAAIVAVRDDGAIVTELVPSQPELACGGAYTRWSPDDSKISLVAQRFVGSSLGPWEVYVCDVVFDAAGDVVGLASQPVTPAVALTDVLNNDWSPDGTRLALNVASGPATGSIWIADLASGGLTQLPISLPATGLAWSPDGTRIAFTCRPNGSNPGGAIRRISPAGTGEATIVSTSAGRLTQPTWSPDGTYLVYQYLPTGGLSTDIYRIPAVGGTAVNLTGDLGGTLSAYGWR